MSDTFDKEAKEFAAFLTKASGSPFVASKVVRDLLLEAGFQELDEAAHWKLELGKKYFFVRNGAAVHAFSIGAKYDLEKLVHLLSLVLTLITLHSH